MSTIEYETKDRPAALLKYDGFVKLLRRRRSSGERVPLTSLLTL
jgi:hypothetical protein